MSTASENHAIDVLERAFTEGVVDGAGDPFFRLDGYGGPLRRWIIILTPRADDTDRDLQEVSSFLDQGLRFGRLDLVSGRERGCSEDGTSAEASPRLVALADRFPGRRSSVCEDWSAPLSKLDGEAIPARGPDGRFSWSHDFSTNSVGCGSSPSS